MMIASAGEAFEILEFRRHSRSRAEEKPACLRMRVNTS
jgi:hypothetical protein